MSRPIDYSKWDHIDESEDEAEAPQPPESGQLQQLQQEPQPHETGEPQQIQQEPPMDNDQHGQHDELVSPGKNFYWGPRFM